jgi:tRNA A37 methylthiotransferase MiaB
MRTISLKLTNGKVVTTGCYADSNRGQYMIEKAAQDCDLLTGTNFSDRLNVLRNVPDNDEALEGIVEMWDHIETWLNNHLYTLDLEDGWRWQSNSDTSDWGLFNMEDEDEQS